MNRKLEPAKPCCYSCRRSCGWIVSRERRHLRLDGSRTPRRFMSNKLNNTKYNLLSFIPMVLFNQFKFFYNLFFLAIALSQFIPALKVGFLITYVSPLAFVLVVTLFKEASDDLKRYSKDKELNNAKIEYLNRKKKEWQMKSSASLRVGDLIKVYQNQRIPTDCVLLHTTEKNGTVFIRTDQLDGETDWKLRSAVIGTQSMEPVEMCGRKDVTLVANAPNDQIYDFKGFMAYGMDLDQAQKEPLGLENTLWQNTVLASTGYIVAQVIYTGKETRSEMNSKSTSTKVGKLDLELNRLSKFLFVLMVIISFGIVALDHFRGRWYVNVFRFVLLLSAIIPISLRVNLDMAKIYYCY